MNCVVCERGFYEWRWWRFCRVDHVDCWLNIGALPVLFTEAGDRYLRSDPVPERYSGQWVERYEAEARRVHGPVPEEPWRE